MTIPSFLFLFMFYTEQKYSLNFRLVWILKNCIKRTSSLFYLISLFPQPALSFGVLLQHPIFNIVFGQAFDPQKAMIMLSIDSFIYLALYFYLEEVFKKFLDFFKFIERFSQMNSEWKNTHCSSLILFWTFAKEKSLFSIKGPQRSELVALFSEKIVKVFCTTIPTTLTLSWVMKA